MANKRQVKKNLKTYSQKVRGKSKRNIRAPAKKLVAPSGTITINPCAEINVVYPAVEAYVHTLQTLKVK